MQPSQVAALLGREIDTGFAAALSDLASSRSLVVDRIVARVGAQPPTSGDAQGTSPDWAVVPWTAEVTLTPTTPQTPGPGPGGSEQGPLPGPGQEAAEQARLRIAELPTRTIRGVGDGWAAIFERWGLHTIGDLAAEAPDVIVGRAAHLAAVALPLLARARDLTEPWPPVPEGMTGRTLAEVAYAALPPADVAQHQLRAHCLRLLGALDAREAARLTL